MRRTTPTRIMRWLTYTSTLFLLNAASICSEYPSYGRALLPSDILHVREALQLLQEKEENEDKDNDVAQLMAKSSTQGNDAATLTLVGYKGGPVDKQINQDRAFVVAPYTPNLLDGSTKNEESQTHPNLTPARLLGVFDGHDVLGEQVSEFAVTEVPKRLAEKLENIFSNNSQSSEDNEVENKIKEALVQTFVEVDRDIPTKNQGGCTASIILQLGSNVYIANAGDSRSFIVVAPRDSRKNRTPKIVYLSREDKPELPDERRRVEAAGGQVWIPPAPENGDDFHESSRVYRVDPDTGQAFGLAMSRSIGDWDMGELGVIPDPIVDILNLKEILAEDDDDMCMEDDNDKETCKVKKYVDDSPVILAVSATDGLMDYLEPIDIAEHLLASFLSPKELHPLVACRDLIFTAAKGWHKDMGGAYRDDIAIAASILSF